MIIMNSLVRRLTLFVSALCLSLVTMAQPSGWGKGDNWESLNPGGGGQHQDFYFDRNVQNRLWFCSDMEGVYRSDDLGKTWKFKGRDLNHGMAFVITQEEGGNRTYEGGLHGAHVSTNAGETWKEIAITRGDAIASIGVSKDHKTVVLGPGWQNKDPQKLQDAILDPVQPLKGKRIVYVSQDRGASWKEVTYQSGNAYRQVFGIAIHPTNDNIYLGSSAGVYVSTNKGDSFTRIPAPSGALNNPSPQDRFNSGCRGVEVSPDGKWIYATFQKSGNSKGNAKFGIYVAKTQGLNAAGDWTEVTANLSNAAEWYDPVIDPRSTANKHNILLGVVNSGGQNRIGLWEGVVNFNGDNVGNRSWKKIADKNGFNFQIGWEERGFIVRTFDYSPKTWNKKLIITMGGMNGFVGDPSKSGWPTSAASWDNIYCSPSTQSFGSVKTWATHGYASPFSYDVWAYENYMIQGTADHGILQSWDHGYSWTSKVFPNGVTNAMSCAVAPLNKPIVLADARKGFGAPPQGVGGLYANQLNNTTQQDGTWRLIGGSNPNSTGTTNGLPSRNFRSIYVDPSDANRVYIGTRNGGLWATENLQAVYNGSSNWKNIGNGALQSKDIRDVWVDPNNSSRLWVRADGGTIYRGVRAGVTNWSWTDMGGVAGGTTDLYVWDNNGSTNVVIASTIGGKKAVWLNQSPNAADWNKAGSWKNTGLTPAGSLSIRPEEWVRPGEPISLGGLAAHDNKIMVATMVNTHKKGLGLFLGTITGNNVSWTDWTADASNTDIPYPRGTQARVQLDKNGKAFYYIATNGTGPWRRPVPTGNVCAVSVSDSDLNFDKDGGSQSITVSSPQNWTASDNKSWITTSKSGSTLTISVSSYTGTESRTGTVTISGCQNRTISITQTGNQPCTLTVSKSSHDFGPSADDVIITVSTTEAFTVSDNAGFITTSVSGDEVTISVNENTGTTSRSGVVTISGCETEQVAINQSGVVPSGQSPFLGTNFQIPGKIEAEFYDNGGQGVAYNDDANKNGDLSFRPADNVDVFAKPAASNGRSIGFSKAGEWVEFTADIETGNYDLIFSYSSGASAQGDLKISIDGSELTTITNILNTGGWTQFTTVTAADIDITGGDDKVIRLEYVNNGGFDMDAIEFVKNDGPPCTLALSSSSANVSADGNTTSFMVTTSEAFSVSEQMNWISTSTNGNTVSVTVSENTSTSARSGMITVAGCETKTFMINQAGAIPVCEFSVSKTSHAFSSAAGSTSVVVTSNESFTVSDNAGFISTSTNGSTVTISVNANGSTNSRSGVVTINGCASETIAITQSGSTPSAGGGKETFDKLPTLNQWSNGSFNGEDGIKWFYTKAKRTKNLNGNTIKLDRSANGSLKANLTGGISTLSFKAAPTGTKNPSVIEVFINGASQGTFTVPKGATKTFNLTASVTGNFELMFKGVSGSDPQLDDITWSGSGARSFVSALSDSPSSDISVYPNPSYNGSITISGSQSGVIQLMTIKGELIKQDNFNNNFIISDLKTGLYLLKLIGANGVISKKVIIK